MAKTRIQSKYLNPNRYWGNWDPREHSVVWEDNDAFAERRAELAYYRKHPAKANLDILLRLLDNFVQQEEEERRSFRTEWNKLIKDYNEAISEINQQNAVITQLNEFILELNSQIEQAYNQQKIIQSKIDQIQNEKQRNRELASIYRNEVVEAFNLVANDIYYLKFAGDEISTIQYIISRMDNENLDDGAVQGLAIEALGKLYAIQKRVARKVADYELTYAITRSKATTLRTQFLKWRDNLFFDTEETCPVDMDFWSRGYFSELMQNVENICHNIEIAPQSADIKIEDLKQLQIELDQLEKLGADSVSIAYSASANSEKAEALSAKTAIILAEDFYFRTVYMGFNNGDERSSYVLQLENHASGIRLQFVFSPLSPTQIGCNYKISFQGYQDENRVNTILNALWAELAPNNIRASVENLRDSIVEKIEFTPQGEDIHLYEINQTSNK